MQAVTWIRRLLPAARARSYCSKVGPEEGKAPEAGPSESEQKWEERIVSGLQPTGALHVGNYFGCVRRLVALQDSGHTCVVFAADLHALTGDATDLESRTLSLAALLLAAGLAPPSLVFRQSAVGRHAELCWLLATLCSHARLEALPQYRERKAMGKDTLAPLLYPVLQAADILLYRGTLVPVGADQQRHVQLAAALAATFHHRYGAGVFPRPRPLLPEPGAERIRSLRDPSKKMSKSDLNSKSRILVTDDEDTIRLKIRKAVTDFEPRVTYEPERRPGVANLIHLHCLAADVTPEEVVEESDALTTAQYKGVVSDALCAALHKVRLAAEELSRRPRVVRDALREGAARARLMADETYADVAARVGLSELRPWAAGGDSAAAEGGAGPGGGGPGGGGPGGGGPGGERQRAGAGGR